jgi:hypothetical protein
MNTMNHLRRQKKESGRVSNTDWSPVACRHVTLLCEQFNARIVVSSTWRYNHDIDELRAFFADNDIAPELVAGTTPSLIHERQRDTLCRGDEIADWLKGNDYCNYVIIDDMPESQFLEEQWPHLVIVQQDVGFASKEAAIRAGEILDGE